jgi:hypothetical protein
MTRETDLQERQRKDAEKAAAVKERQIRQGHLSAPVVEEEVPAPKKTRTRKKST